MTTTPPSRSEAAVLGTGGRSSTTAVAVTPHHLSSAAALEVISTGGNAADGAIAANAVQGVVAPETCGIGGDLFALVQEPGVAVPFALNASGRAGSGVTSAELRVRFGSEIPYRDPAAITVPGCVDGWIALNDRFGRLPLAAVIAPAVRLAEGGFEVSDELAGSLMRLQTLIGGQASAAPLYPGDRPADAGATIARPRLAQVMRDVAGGGRDAFYLGEVGRGIIEATDHLVALEDLERRNADWVEPIGIDVFGMRAWTMPPNTQGHIALAAAWIFEQLDVPRDPESPLFTHATIEAYRSIAWERDDVVADPTTAPLPAERLLDPKRLERFVDTISPETSGRFPRPGTIPGGTAYLCVRDGDGMGVSFIQSNFSGIGSGRSAGSTGVFLHNRGAGFNLIEGHPNEYAPGRRPLHTLSPTLWTNGGKLSMLLGSRGGQFQPQLLLQMIAAHLHAGLPIGEAQHRARWQVEGWQRDTPSTVGYEPRMADQILDGLRFRRHDIRPAAPWEGGWGPVAVITSQNDIVEGAADPRVSTTAALAG